MTKKERIAIALHSAFCGMNHTDGCSWYYGINNDVHDWKEWAHDKYLQYAVTTIKMFPNTKEERIIEIIRMFSKMY